MPTTAPEADVLHAQLQRRLVESGEWDRIQSILAAKLNENGWLDNLKHRSKERARSEEHLRFEELYNEFTPSALASLPLAVKREITALIRQYLEKQFA